MDSATHHYPPIHWMNRVLNVFENNLKLIHYIIYDYYLCFFFGSLSDPLLSHEIKCKKKCMDSATRHYPLIHWTSFTTDKWNLEICRGLGKLLISFRYLRTRTESLEDKVSRLSLAKTMDYILVGEIAGILSSGEFVPRELCPPGILSQHYLFNLIYMQNVSVLSSHNFGTWYINDCQ